MEREAEVLEMPAQADAGVMPARRVAQGRAAIARYVERLEAGTRVLAEEPDASELYCALAELREGMIENDPETARTFYEKALESFSLSRGAQAGFRRLSRAAMDYEAVVASIEQELLTADTVRKAALRRELVRTDLYCANDPERALLELETIASENAQEDAPFDEELFYLWEDALLATGDWCRYEKFLHASLAKQTEIGDMARHIETRMWIVYRYILPDASQADVLWHHLLSCSPTDDELTEYALHRKGRDEDPELLRDTLLDALSREGASAFEIYYRLFLADVAVHQLHDVALALEVLSAGIAKYPNDVQLLHRNLTLSLEESDCETYLQTALAPSLGAMTTPALKAEQLTAIAHVFSEQLDTENEALEVYLEASRICPTYTPALQALVEFYTKHGQWSELAQQLEYELNYAIAQNDTFYTAEVFCEKHALLAWIYEKKLSLYFKSFNHYQAMLEIRPDDIAALKGAARMTSKIGNWPELLKLYAAAEGVTQDPAEHVYLLEQIAEIAKIHLEDADTACTALEAIRQFDVHRPRAVSELAKLYITLGKWEKFIALNEEEIASAKNPEYKATLYCRVAEVALEKLGNHAQAIQNYEKALAAWPQSLEAYLALERLYDYQNDHEKLVELWRAHVTLCQDIKLKCDTLHKIARGLEKHLGNAAGALEVYESCLALHPSDSFARRVLLEAYQKAGRWEDMLRILKLELGAGGTFSHKWLSWLWMGKIRQYRLDEPEEALACYERAVEENGQDLALMRTWMDLALSLGRTDAVLEKLAQKIETTPQPELRRIYMRLYVEQRLCAGSDLLAVSGMIRDDLVVEADADAEQLPKADGAVLDGWSWLIDTLCAMIIVRRQKWLDHLQLAFERDALPSLQRHALEAAIVLDMPSGLHAQATREIQKVDVPMDVIRMWSSLPPARRPDFHLLRGELLEQPMHEAQDLRRWVVVSRLLSGDISDPTERLLPDERDEALAYRPDLELLAAYFETFEKWNEVLNVYEVQIANTRNEQEHIAIILQRAYVLKSKLNRRQEAIESIREACTICSFDNPSLDILYDSLAAEKDWDFLADRIRKHLVHETDNKKKAALWLRLANIFETGRQSLDKALECLDQVYQNDAGDGTILVRISHVARQIEEYDIARNALDDYIEHFRPSLDVQLSLSQSLLELHFYVPGGDPRRMLSYFEALAKKAAHSRETLILLAKAHARAGDAQVAASRILEVVATPFERDDLSLWLILVDLYIDRLDHAKTGEKLLWQLFTEFPDMESIFERLNCLYNTNPERRIFVENIKNYVASSEAVKKNASLKRKYLSFAAKILSNELRMWNEANDLYAAALEASEEPADALVKELADSRARVPGEARNAYKAYCELLVRDPFQADVYRNALEICRKNEAADRIRILSQMARIFVPDADLPIEREEGRTKKIDGRALREDQLDEFMLHPALRQVRPVLQEAMPLILSCNREILPKAQMMGSERVREASILELFQTAARSFSLDTLKLRWRADVSLLPCLSGADAWISQEIWADMTLDMQRHWSGFVGGLAWTGLEGMLNFEPEEIWHYLDGIYYIAKGESLGERDAYTLEAAEKVRGNIFMKGQHRAVADLIDKVGREYLTISAARHWVDALKETADRAGLLFSGSMSTSILAVLAAEGWNPAKATPAYIAERYRSLHRLPALIEFALSEEYLKLRQAAGLVGFPSTING